MSRARVVFAALVAAIAASTYTVTVNSGQQGDQTQPTVSMTAPSAGTVSGTITVSASASDNVGVVGVQFKLDGANLQAEDTSDPYSISFDTTTTTDGAHELTATARDAAGNAATASAVAVTVSNGGGGPISANIWVDSSGGTCADSSTLLAYPNNGTECGTLNAAVQAAEAGDIIAVRAGTYSSETISYRSALQNLSPGCDPYGTWGSVSTANCVKIVNDGEVKFRGLVNNASALWFQGPVTGGTVCSSVSTCSARTYSFRITNSDLIGNPPAGADDDAACNCQSANFRAARPGITSTDVQRPDHIIVDGLDVDTLSIYASSNVLVRNTDVGPMWFDTPNRGSSSGAGPDVPRIWATSGGSPSDIVWDGVFAHEMNRTFWCDVDNACHNDGLFINSGGPITVRNSGFSQIAGEVFFVENFSGNPDVNSLTMENTWLGCKVNSYPDAPASARTTCGSGAPIDIKNCGTTCNGVLFRFNSWYSITGAETSYTNARFVGNAGAQPGTGDPFCIAATWTYNAWYTQGSGGNCGATNANTGSSSCTSLFSSCVPGSENFHMAGSAGSTLADDFVSPTTSDYTLTTDMDGDSRPLDANRDAGADERNTP